MKDRKEMSESFRARRDANRLDNRNRAHGVRVHGTYYEYGVPNPGSFLKIGGVKEIVFNGKTRS
jgi:hypothetical protein